MRLAELLMAIVMGLFSVYLMIKSAELPIGWIPEQGPGGGAFPFWLSVGMLLCCIAMVINWLRKSSPPARSTEAYMSPQAWKQFAISAGSLGVTIGLFHIIGVYFAIPMYLIFSMRTMGGHSWRLCGAVAFGVVVVTFLFFEITLNIVLPKGVTEPLFYPLYDIFFS